MCIWLLQITCSKISNKHITNKYSSLNCWWGEFGIVCFFIYQCIHWWKGHHIHLHFYRFIHCLMMTGNTIRAPNQFRCCCIYIYLAHKRKYITIFSFQTVDFYMTIFLSSLWGHKGCESLIFQHNDFNIHLINNVLKKTSKNHILSILNCPCRAMRTI